MKVLLTGASGFVGSHILDGLRRNKINTAVLLRPTSDTGFLQPHLPELEVCRGSITDPASLVQATAGVTHIVHCAGCTKAVKASEFYRINHLGTRNVVDAANTRASQLQRLIHISSLAVSGPATPQAPATEEAPPHPVSIYGKSKLAGELEVREHSQTPFTILRPPAVYGPRDTGFLSMFKAVKQHILPRPKKNQVLSLVYVKDLAEAVLACLNRPETIGQTYFVASAETSSGRGMAELIAERMGAWTFPCPMPAPALWTVCLLQQILSQLTGRPSVLSLQKYAELRAPGWVCNSSKLQRQIGFECKTPLKQGIAETLDWYARKGWL